MLLAEISIKRPVFATMMIASLVTLGIVSYPSIGVDLFPKVDVPVVTVTTVLKGASPEIMDVDITDKIEEAVSTINGVNSISSNSIEGKSAVIIEFFLERNIDQAVQDVREKISIIRSQLPSDILEPVIMKVDPDAVPVLWLNLTGRKSVRDLSTYADEILSSQIQKIQGVGAIQMAGIRRRQIRVSLNTTKLTAYKITAQDVARALKRENVELPGGRIETQTKEYSIKVKGEFNSPQEFNELILGYFNGTPVKLKDVGRAEDSKEEMRSIARFNGEPAIALGIQKQSGSNTVEIVDRIKSELTNIQKVLPPGMSISISFDQSVFIKRSINEVKHHLVYGGFFAALAVFLFLKNIRITLISALAIPTSIIATFFIIYIFKFTFNNMSMLALTLSIGILIDDAIIVIENIHRHMEMGIPPKKAALIATSEIGLAVMATTLAVVAIFLPVGFMKGMIGRFFMQFALTVVFAVSVSLLISFTLTPMLAAKFLKIRHNYTPGTIKWRLKQISDWLDKPYLIMEKVYKHILIYALRHRAIVVLLAIGIFAFSMYMTKFIGKEFIPPEDQGTIILRLEAPIDYSIEESDKMFKRVEKYLKSFPEIKTAFYGLGLDQGDINKGTMYITFIPKSQRKKNQEQLKKEIRLKLIPITGLKATAEDVSMLGGGLRQVPVQVNIKGPDLTVLQKHTNNIVKRISKIPGFVDIDTSIQQGKPELRVYVNRDKAADLGVNISTVTEAINLLIGGEVDVTKYKDEKRGRRYDVRMRLYQKDRMNPLDIKNIYVRSNDGRLIELSSIVDIKETGGPNLISRADRQRAIMLYANLDNKPLGEAMEQVKSIMGKVLTREYTGKFRGRSERMAESFQYLMFAIVLGIVMAYMILASQFGSFIHPFTILLSMPFSFIGAFTALLIAGMTLNIFSFIGLILLMGLVKKNAILLVDYTNTLRSQGMERREAIIHAGPVRLKPILMTTIAMIFGMLPIAIGIGEGAETRAPMAVTTIGGLISSLFLTLIVIPVVYDLFDSGIQWVKSLRKQSVKDN